MKHMTNTFAVIFAVILIIGVSLSEASQYNFEVYEAQKILKDLGYDAGPLDGMWGKSTQSAIKKYQKAHSLAETGLLDKQTKEYLGVSSSATKINCGFKNIDTNPTR